MSSNVCDIINGIDNYFVDDPNTPGEHTSGSLLSFNCPNNNCDSYDKKISSTFIELLKYFEYIDDEDNLESDQLAEYAILWLSYRLNQKKGSGTTKLYDFYTNNIKTNSQYEDISTDSNSKIKKDVIENKIKSMNIDIKDISNFYDAFKSLFNMYSEFDPEKNTECKTCLENVGELFEKYEKLKNALDINKGSSYYELLSSLSNDYKKFKEKYNNLGCSHISPLVACPRSSVTKNILITIAIIFVVASILLGVSYKYSLFGFRKRSQKQHLREKLKK
ncbi:PIR protein [Plasmodium yoelii]|uniref:PIR protein n=2 Tax=Plasmodium yoelii TaxID=5861 RepID=A0AAE9WSQ6_PLAYO|nr:PIR protein [Plasmodium yoelii]WBY55864.1 PIR protein [Plasmodium yoelii yoelii]CDS44366.1 YIR protein [Plasmodium yoelii]VTZ75094.1 PIR protein [Plasmodium yoelii]|eukprot:XP_022813099.1 PIR protein [Plasmodium yoelii]